MDNVLVVGGTSGLGLEIAKLFASENEVFVWGRKKPNEKKLNFQYLDLSGENLSEEIEALVHKLPNLDIVIYAPGFFQEGKIDELSPKDILKMNRVGLIGAEFLMNSVMRKQKGLKGFIAITSTSQLTPREREPIYTAVKAGLAMFASSLSLDSRIGKTLVAAPAGMKTPFWNDFPKARDTSVYLEPDWVAQQIINHFNSDSYKFKEILVLRDPSRVIIRETR